VDECKPLPPGTPRSKRLLTDHGSNVLLFMTGHGEAVQVDRIKPKLKPPGTNRLELNYDILPSTTAFKFNLRRYTTGGTSSSSSRTSLKS